MGRGHGWSVGAAGRRAGPQGHTWPPARQLGPTAPVPGGTFCDGGTGPGPLGSASTGVTRTQVMSSGHMATASFSSERTSPNRAVEGGPPHVRPSAASRRPVTPVSHRVTTCHTMSHPCHTRVTLCHTVSHRVTPCAVASPSLSRQEQHQAAPSFSYRQTGTGGIRPRLARSRL